MWYGCRYNGNGRYSQQNNNSSEKMVGRLETCGPTSAINCYDATHLKPAPYLYFGEGKIQPEDAFANVMNNLPEYRSKMKEIRPDISPDTFPANEIIQYYPFFAKLCLKAKVELRQNASVQEFQRLFKEIPGCAIQGWLKAPNHFICVKGFNDNEDFFRCNDPWEGNQGLAGFDHNYSFSGLRSNLQPYFLLWFPEEYDL